mmetsp:Transcript_52559/g.154940  ORF Transcript_52559/g.154940 Transcript_52559/m.154940 type:complete len:201 (+) Transcript_52559:1328-1930(+)
MSAASSSTAPTSRMSQLDWWSKTLLLNLLNFSITSSAWVSDSSTRPWATRMKFSGPKFCSTDCWCSCTMSAISMNTWVRACAKGVGSASTRLDGISCLNSWVHFSARDRRMYSVYFLTPSPVSPRGWKSLAKRVTPAESLAMMHASNFFRTIALSCCSASWSTRTEASSVPGGSSSWLALNLATYFVACSKSSDEMAFIT